MQKFAATVAVLVLACALADPILAQGLERDLITGPSQPSVGLDQLGKSLANDKPLWEAAFGKIDSVTGEITPVPFPDVVEKVSPERHYSDGAGAGLGRFYPCGLDHILLTIPVNGKSRYYLLVAFFFASDALHSLAPDTTPARLDYRELPEARRGLVALALFDGNLWGPAGSAAATAWESIRLVATQDTQSFRETGGMLVSGASLALGGDLKRVAGKSVIPITWTYSANCSDCRHEEVLFELSGKKANELKTLSFWKKNRTELKVGESLEYDRPYWEAVFGGIDPVTGEILLSDSIFRRHFVARYPSRVKPGEVQQGEGRGKLFPCGLESKIVRIGQESYRVVVFQFARDNIHAVDDDSTPDKLDYRWILGDSTGFDLFAVFAIDGHRKQVAAIQDPKTIPELGHSFDGHSEVAIGDVIKFADKTSLPIKWTICWMHEGVIWTHYYDVSKIEVQPGLQDSGIVPLEHLGSRKRESCP